MNSGDAFFIQNRSVDAPLWVVVSDPEKDPDRVVIVSITTYENHKESACLLNAVDHPRITHKSSVFYKETRMTTLESLRALRDRGALNVQPAVSAQIPARIRDGVSRSTTIKAKYIDILLEQGVIQ